MLHDCKNCDFIDIPEEATECPHCGGTDLIMQPIFLQVGLTDTEKLAVIKELFECYFNTNQHSRTFSQEFFYSVDLILRGNIPITLIYLIEFEDFLIKAVPRLGEVFESIKRIGEVNERK